MNKFSGKILFLDRSDINTDEIIPAKYLTEISKQALKPHTLEDLKLKDFKDTSEIKSKNIIITRENFGCGSSREHAVWALEVNNINVVIAQSFARIFRQNMFNCGLLAIELGKKEINELFKYKNNDISLSVNIKTKKISIKGKDFNKEYNFDISPFDNELVKAGGWVEYADKRY